MRASFILPAFLVRGDDLRESFHMLVPFYQENKVNLLDSWLNYRGPGFVKELAYLSFLFLGS